MEEERQEIKQRSAKAREAEAHAEAQREANARNAANAAVGASSRGGPAARSRSPPKPVARRTPEFHPPPIPEHEQSSILTINEGPPPPVGGLPLHAKWGALSSATDESLIAQYSHRHGLGGAESLGGGAPGALGAASNSMPGILMQAGMQMTTSNAAGAAGGQQENPVISRLVSQQQLFMKHLESQVEGLRQQRDAARKAVFELRDQKLDEKAAGLREVGGSWFLLLCLGLCGGTGRSQSIMIMMRGSFEMGPAFPINVYVLGRLGLG